MVLVRGEQGRSWLNVDGRFDIKIDCGFRVEAGFALASGVSFSTFGKVECNHPACFFLK